MATKRGSNGARRKLTTKTESIGEEEDKFSVSTDRATLLGEYNNQMLKCKFGRKRNENAHCQLL